MAVTSVGPAARKTGTITVHRPRPMRPGVKDREAPAAATKNSPFSSPKTPRNPGDSSPGPRRSKSPTPTFVSGLSFVSLTAILATPRGTQKGR